MSILATKRSTRGPHPAGEGLSQLLARMARTLASHWKRSLAAAIGVLVLPVLAAGVAGDATDDVSLPGSESQQATDLFQAHSPAFGGVDSTSGLLLARFTAAGRQAPMDAVDQVAVGRASDFFGPRPGEQPLDPTTGTLASADAEATPARRSS